ncbi:MAG TPA: class E sortase [Candidatus Saccharimonadales bacterium]|nr:class E sortase [Candidatus Saccharimonadales bacterium]
MPLPKEWNEPVSHDIAKLTENRLYIPKLKLNVPYGITEEALNSGAWHRYPERGDSEKGGNFILAGHRFEMGWTYQEINKKSPFYHIDQLHVGDDIFIDFNGKRYQYKIEDRLKVKPTQIEIEASSNDAKLTLYTCTLGGEMDGREVIVARLKTTDVDPSLQF